MGGGVHKSRGAVGLACLFGLAMLPLARVDYRWTLHLFENRWPRLVAVMGRTLTEGEAFGGGDPVALVLAAAAGAYLVLSFRPRLGASLRAWRIRAGFVVTAALVNGVFLVHGLKWAVGRARPHEVVGGDLPFTPWYVFGPHFLGDGPFNGSFPSGHTAQAFLAMTLVYLVCGEPGAGLRRRAAGWAMGGLVIGYAAVMGVARCMALSHWVTDVAGSVLMSWVLLHLLFHRALRVPDLLRRPRWEPPRFWELRICGWLLAATLGGVFLAAGVRGAAEGRSPAWLLAGGAGLAAAAWALRRARDLMKRPWDGAGNAGCRHKEGP